MFIHHFHFSASQLGPFISVRAPNGVILQLGGEWWCSGDWFWGDCLGDRKGITPGCFPASLSLGGFLVSWARLLLFFPAAPGLFSLSRTFFLPGLLILARISLPSQLCYFERSVFRAGGWKAVRFPGSNAWGQCQTCSQPISGATPSWLCVGSCCFIKWMRRSRLLEPQSAGGCGHNGDTPPHRGPLRYRDFFFKMLIELFLNAYLVQETKLCISSLIHMGVICCFNVCALALHVHPYINDLDLTFSNTERMAWCHKKTGIWVLELQGEVWYGMYQTINGVFLRGRRAFKGKRNVYITTSLSIFSLGALFGNTLAIKTPRRVGHNWLSFDN